MQCTIDTEKYQATIKYNVICLSKESINFKKWSDTLKSEEMRRTVVEDGYAQADAFLLEHSDANALLGRERTVDELD